MDDRCRLGSLGNTSTATGSRDPLGMVERATVRSSGFIFRACWTFFHINLSHFTFFLRFFDLIFALPIRKGSGNTRASKFLRLTDSTWFFREPI